MWNFIRINVDFTKKKYFSFFCRIFERRLGSRKFASHLIAMMLLSTILEYWVTPLLMFSKPRFFSGLLATGPWVCLYFSAVCLQSNFELIFHRFGLVLPWFIYYFKDVPSLNSTSVMGIRVSNKAMPYLIGLQVILGSCKQRRREESVKMRVTQCEISLQKILKCKIEQKLRILLLFSKLSNLIN